MENQICRVDTGTIDGDECGNEWHIFYSLCEAQDDDGQPCFELWTDDGKGNGDYICRGYHKNNMISMVLRLGTFVCWVSVEDDAAKRAAARVRRAQS